MSLCTSYFNSQLYSCLLITYGRLLKKLMKHLHVQTPQFLVFMLRHITTRHHKIPLNSRYTAHHPTWQPHTKLSLILEILKFLNCSYFTKIMTKKPKIGNLTNKTKNYPFLESKKWYLLFKGILWSHDLLVKTTAFWSINVP